jgi:hypothetical protein
MCDPEQIGGYLQARSERSDNDGGKSSAMSEVHPRVVDIFNSPKARVQDDWIGRRRTTGTRLPATFGEARECQEPLKQRHHPTRRRGVLRHRS